MKHRHASLVFRKLAAALVVAALMLQSLSAAASPLADRASQANMPLEALLARMTPEEKVGQLFVVSFQGRDVSENSAIVELIRNKHIGGVVLARKNNNFTEPETVTEAAALIAGLQQAEFDGTSENLEDPVSGSFFTPQYVPLFVGLSQEGDLIPSDQIISGLTPMPSMMTLGATWSTEMAGRAGAVAGYELSALGVNFLFAPDLDVFDVLRPAGNGEAGSITLGADPYWVGALGKAYVAGLQTGSQNRIATIAKYFPGRGSSDRSADLEVATVKKTLENLTQVDLAPFLAVAGAGNPTEGVIDGMLLSHTRYEGLQGSVTSTTKPVSLDLNAIDQLFSMPVLLDWRQGGGLIVSDNLGSQAIRRFYDPIMQRFDARQVARDAFLAGNDLLYVDDFIASGFTDQYATISDTLLFFSQKYREDAAFAQRVDESVRRILAAKFRIYPSFSLNTVLPATDLISLGTGNDTSFSIIQAGATLISPGAAEVALAIPQAPRMNDRLVFITDTDSYSQCQQCPPHQSIAVNGFQNNVLKLYGPAGSGQVAEYRLSSYTTNELRDYLNNQDTTGKIENDLRNANWIVFAMFNEQSLDPQNGAVHRFLSTRPELQQNKKLIGFSFTSPINLDSTDLSKLTAYYALYTKIPVALEVATRILFREITPKGNSPVPVPSVGYDLVEMVKPDPRQVIALSLDMENYRNLQRTPAGPGYDGTAPLPEIPTFDVGDSIPVITGVILDRNQRHVPDGTKVTFSFATTGDSENVQLVETVTRDGVASAVYRITNRGVLEIKASAEPALTSQILRLNIVGGVQAAITVIAPTPAQAAMPEPTATTVVPTPVVNTEIQPPEKMKPTVLDWFLTMVLIFGIGAGFGMLGSRIHNLRWGVRWGALSTIGGIIAYTMVITGVFGGQLWGAAGGFAPIMAFILLGCVLGWLVGYLWQSLVLN